MQRQAVSKILLYEWEVVITVPSSKRVRPKHSYSSYDKISRYLEGQELVISGVFTWCGEILLI